MSQALSRPLVRLLPLAALVWLASCATPATHQPSSTPLPPAPALPKHNATVYRVLPEHSQLRVRVYRAGALAALGHDHVITSARLEGEIYLHAALRDSGFELRMPLASLQVDPPAARRQAGLPADISDQDRAGTRHNMLGAKVLDAKQYPLLKLRSMRVQGPARRPRISVRVSLHGQQHDYTVPTAIVRDQDRLVAIGALTIRQSDFGIRPFRVLAGALAIRDELDVRFRVVAVAQASRPKQHQDEPSTARAQASLKAHSWQPLAAATTRQFASRGMRK